MSAFDPKRTLGHPLLVADEVFGSEANAPYAGPILLGPCAKGDSDEGVKKMMSGTVVAILPCNDLDLSERFYRRLGFARIESSVSKESPTYRMLSNGNGQLHLTATVEDWLIPGRNPFGLYFYMEDVDAWAKEFRDEIRGKGPEEKPWGMYEFAVSDPDQTLVRVGWPIRLRKLRTTEGL